ncbi:MAG: hypothetical protein Hals2KO_31570 [Halioglobus sp.]
MEPLLSRYVLASPDSIPEGVAFDPVSRLFYASSLQGASITTVAADGTETLFREADNSARLGGIKVDAENRRVWVCATGIDSSNNHVWLFDVETGERLVDYPLGALSTAGACNDLVLDSNGLAYVTDPANPYIYKLDPVSGEGEVFATDPRFADLTGIGLGLNGIAVSDDGNDLIVARFTPAQLLRVSLADSSDIAIIELSGDALPTPDGLAVLNGDVYAVADNAIARIRLAAGNSSGEVVVAPQISGLSTATVAEGALYAIKSEVTNYVLQRPLNLPFEIFSVDIAAFGP